MLRNRVNCQQGRIPAPTECCTGEALSVLTGPELRYGGSWVVLHGSDPYLTQTRFPLCWNDVDVAR